MGLLIPSQTVSNTLKNDFTNDLWFANLLLEKGKLTGNTYRQSKIGAHFQCSQDLVIQYKSPERTV